MIPYSSLFIEAFTIEDVILDKDTGAPLSGGLVYFYEDEQRTVLKPVYQITGTSPNYMMEQLPNPMVLSAIGTFVDSMGNPTIPYFYPYDDAGNIQRYYVRCTSALGVFQFARETQPDVWTTTIPPDQIINGENELINPQFAQVFFNSTASHTYTFSSASNESVQVAPGWNLIVSGSGTVIVERIALTELDTPSNPPYVLDIECSGVNSIILRQRLSQSPRLLARSFVTGYFIAASQDNDTHTLQMQYNPSGGNLDSNIVIDDTVSADGSYNVLRGFLEITGDINPDPATTGYVDIDIVIPQGSHLRISSFQLVGTNVGINLFFDQQPVQLQLNQLFNVYMSSIQTQSKTSITPWWFFPANPVQFGGNNASVASVCSYIFDQTILYQPAINQVGVFIEGSDNARPLVVKAVANATDARFALITYIDPKSCYGLWDYYLSCFARMTIDTSHSTQITAKMRILYRADLPPTISSSNPIASWTLGQDPSFAAGWTEIAPLNDPAYTVGGIDTSAGPNNAFSGYSYNQFSLPASNNDAERMLAIVFYIMEPLNSTSGSEDSFVIERISTVQNQFAIDWTPPSYDHVLRACQYYWEKSYQVETPVGTVTDTNAVAVWFDSEKVSPSDVKVFINQLTIEYQNKRGNPTPILFSPNTGTPNAVSVRGISYGGVVNDESSVDEPVNTIFSNVLAGTKRTVYKAEASSEVLVVTGGGIADTTRGFILFHFEIDSRIGR